MVIPLYRQGIGSKIVSTHLPWYQKFPTAQVHYIKWQSTVAPPPSRPLTPASLVPPLWIQPVKWKSVMSNCLQSHGPYSPWNSPGQNTGVGSLSLLQGIFPTQGSNPGLLHCMQILYQLRHYGSPGIPKWVAYPFSSGSSQPRNQTRVSCVAGRVFANYGSNP